ncbi:MAG: hypothetical protein H6581_13265 [Bacteroidia bacterium]|nr:hypothetical protein [Bacteroidia bacterium]
MKRNLSQQKGIARRSFSAWAKWSATLILVAGIFLCALFLPIHSPAGHHHFSHYSARLNGPGGKFEVSQPSLNGDRLEFSYFSPYPGVTKVKLFDRTGELIWRNQYNDLEGNNRVIYRANLLESGETYVFEFEYKKDKILRTVSIP